MKKIFLAVCIALTLTGCGENSKRDNGRASEADVSAPQKNQSQSVETSMTNGSIVAVDQKEVILLGKAFAGSSFDPPYVLAGGKQIFPHYGSTSATVVLDRTFNRVTADFKPSPKDDSYPKVYLSAQRTGLGPHTNTAILIDEIIRSEEPVTREVSLEAGTWVISLGYYGSSGKTRTALQLNSIRFE